MKFSEQWLREWVPVTADTQTIVDTLTMAGLEVDSIQSTEAEFSGIIVAEVVSVTKHPEANKLKLVQINSGNSELVQVVCGANNVKTGIKVAFAQIGAKLPGNITIKQAKLKSVDSFGMLCAADELGLEDKSSGLYILDKNAPIGTDIAEYLQLNNDHIIDIDLTPNRGDCLSIMGLSCEMSALFQQQSKLPYTATTITRNINDTIAVNVQAATSCPHYCGCIIRNINIKAMTPTWMQERLRRSGIRSIDPIVDITNYVMLEQGQPMHGFDLAKLQGEIHIRMAMANETLELLDGKKITLSTDNLVIADNDKALALAGIMGGKSSSITAGTKDIFLESAFFSPEVIAGKARTYGLHTDSSHRFERGVDFRLQTQALERATQLIIEICGGEAGAITSISATEALPKRNAIKLRTNKINALLGIDIDKNYIEQSLKYLGCSVNTISDTPTTYTVIPPTWRFDLAIEADLIEEIARLHGYDNLTLAKDKSNFNLNQAVANTNSNIEQQLLVSRGYYEIISYSFIDPKSAELCCPHTDKLLLVNPISQEQSVMRGSLIPGLLKTAKYNLNRQQNRIKIFELGQIFTTEDHKVKSTSFAILATGSIQPLNWKKNNRNIDFYTLKNDVHALLTVNNNFADIKYSPAKHASMHPGQCAKIIKDNIIVGYIGCLHPSLATKFGLAEQTFIAELDYQAITKSTIVKYQSISKYPEIKRDLSFIIQNFTTAQQLIECIISSTSDKLINTQIFDVYSGEGIKTGYKNIGISLFFQDKTRTLQDDEINIEIDNIINTAQEQLNAQLRDF